MSYTTNDFTESLTRVGLAASDVEAVVAAWGKGDGQGEDAGHYRWAEDGVSDWAGGFLMRLKVGVYIYVTGWCDYTGWGCQDGAEVRTFDHEPTVEEMTAASERHSEPVAAEWDLEPADLNKWIADGATDPDGVDVSE